jgi:hypothetical protein
MEEGDEHFSTIRRITAAVKPNAIRVPMVRWRSPRARKLINKIITLEPIPAHNAAAKDISCVTSDIELS